MRAPAKMFDDKTGEATPFYRMVDGRRVYTQISDELLAAFEADAKSGTLTLHSIGCLVARIREAEADRERLVVAMRLIMPFAEHYADAGGSRGPEQRDVADAKEALQRATVQAP